MKVRVINTKTKREVPSFMLHLYITYDEKGNMKCIDDEYELQFKDEKKDKLEWKLNEANEYLRVHNETLEDKLEMLEDKDV